KRRRREVCTDKVKGESDDVRYNQDRYIGRSVISALMREVFITGVTDKHWFEIALEQLALVAVWALQLGPEEHRMARVTNVCACFKHRIAQ
ncbi:MAG: hypothetical protein WBA90_08790, partial [Albidovulum sp.]